MQSENHIATTTSEARTLLAARATTEQSEADRAATATAARQATTTTESQATEVIAATQTAEYVSTATAEQVATGQAQAAFARAQEATATAQHVATADAAATLTALWQATATSQAVATVQSRTTLVAERERTATAQRIATESARATQTAQAIGTATAEARSTPTATPAPEARPKVNVLLLACDTGLDVLSGLGEVINGWVTVQNVGDAEATNVLITLSADDEDEIHPDKTQSVSFLPPGFQITYKLSVDTRVGPKSGASVEVTADENIEETDSISSCLNLDEDARKLIDLAGQLGKLIGIPPLKPFR